MVIHNIESLQMLVYIVYCPSEVVQDLGNHCLVLKNNFCYDKLATEILWVNTSALRIKYSLGTIPLRHRLQ